MASPDLGSNRQFALSTPWYYGWNIVAVTVLFQAFVTGLMFYSYPFWIAPFQEDFGSSIGTILLGSSLASIFMGIYSAMAGRFMDRHSIRRLALGGTALFAIGYILISMATALWQIILIYSTLMPLSAVFCGSMGAQVATTRWFTQRRGLALGVSSAGSSLGGFIFPPIITALIGSYGWRISHIILAIALIIILIPPLVLLLRERQEDDVEPGASETDITPAASVSQTDTVTTLTLLRNKMLWFLVLAFIPLLIGFSTVHYNLAPIAADANIGPQQAAYLMSVIAITMVFGKLFFGWMADRYQHHFLLWSTATLLLVSLLMLQVAGSYATFVLCYLLMGFASGGTIPLMGAVVASQFPPSIFGRVRGLVSMLTMLATFAPVVFGYLRADLNSYVPIFQILMLIAAPSFIFSYFLGRSNRTFSSPTDA